MYSRWFPLGLVLAGCGGGPVRHTPDASRDAPHSDSAPDVASDACNASHCCSAADCPSSNYACEAHACVNVAGTLSGLLWQLPCTSDQSATVCSTNATADVSAVVGGTTGLTYDITVHLLGIVEQKTYTNGCTSAYWTAGGTDNGDAFNVYELSISSPPQHYFLNTGASNIYNAFTLDYTRTFRADAGATVELYATSKDGGEIKNVDAGGNPLTVSGTSVTQPYNGQFIEMTITSVTPDPIASSATIGGGSAGFALSFAGAQKVSIPDAASIDAADFTVESWFQFAGTPGSYNAIADKPVGTGSEDSLALWYQSGSLLAGVSLSNTSGAAAIPWTATTGQWHHAAVTYDHASQVSSLYVDGALTACSTNTAPTYDTHAMLLGADNDNGTEQGYWDGLLDETRLFSTVRSADQVWADLHTHQLGATTGLVGEWTFDEGSGATTADSSGTGNTATLGATTAAESTDPTWVSSDVPH